MRDRTRLSLRGLPKTAALACLALAVGCGARKEDSTAPREPVHLLLITLDTLRADRLGSYGYDKPTSPVLDALASDALLFENAVAQSAVTPVSHASILTGLNPYRHGLRSLHGGAGYALPQEKLTLAELMRANGRETAGFVSAFPASRHFGLDHGFDTWDEEFERPETGSLLTEAGLVRTGSAQRRADDTTERAISWLRNRGDDPFFLWVHYFDVHDPLILPPSMYLSKFRPESSGQGDRRLATYDAEVAFIDFEVGQLLGALEDEGVRDRTVVVVVGDHGEGLGDHGWWGHSILYREQTRVPFILSVPGEEWSGRVDALVRTIDIVPTLVDVMNLQCPSDACDFDGQSLRSVIEAEPSESPLAYSESINDLSAYYESPLKDDSLYAVQDARFKLIARYEGATPKPSMLFDLGEDPAETRNIIEEHPDVEARFRAYLEAQNAVVTERNTEPLDEQTRERLRSLGYVK